MSHLKEKD
jgi:Growth-Arrest-Specific Protein 2 Domain